MSNLTLVLKEPIEKLVPKLISWNNNELMKEVSARLQKYKDIVYTEDCIAEAKKDRAALNSFAKALNDDRKLIKKIYTEPLDKFTSEVNEVLDEINIVADKIGAQIKEFETVKKSEKLKTVEELFNSKLPQQYVGLITFERICNTDWGNATKRLSSIEKEIDDIIKNITNDLAALEQSCENVIEAKDIYFVTLSLSETLSEYERRKAQKRLINEKTAQDDKLQEEVPKSVRNQTEDVTEQIYSITFKAVGTMTQLTALKTFMKEQNIKFERG